MTKLTKEQIEQERVKFEEWFLNEFKLSIANNLFENYYYRNSHINDYWKPWLARAELAKGGE